MGAFLDTVFLSIFICYIAHGEVRYCGAGECLSTTVTCEQWHNEEKCTIICDGNNACDGSLLLCSADRPCELICKGTMHDDPCSGITIDAWTAEYLIVNSTCEPDSPDTDCIHANGGGPTHLRCPNGGACSLYCLGGTSCGGYSENGNQVDHYIVVNATFSTSFYLDASGSDSAGAMQLHCPIDGTCSIEANGDATPYPPLTDMDIYAPNFADVDIVCTGSNECFNGPPPVMHCNSGTCNIGTTYSSCDGSTACPSTQYPSKSPTTITPTTNNPTINPTTNEPTTYNPTTFSPTTVSPTTFVPTTNNPTTKYTTNNPSNPVTGTPTNNPITTTTLGGSVGMMSTDTESNGNLNATANEGNTSGLIIVIVIVAVIICCLLCALFICIVYEFWYKKKRNKMSKVNVIQMNAVQIEHEDDHGTLMNVVPDMASIETENVQTTTTYASTNGGMNETNGSDSKLKNWLGDINLLEYYHVFAENGFDENMATLKKLNDDDLKEMGIKKIAHRIVILQNIQQDDEEFDKFYAKGETNTVQ